MTQRSDFQIQILEKLGAPLMAAAGGVSARQKPDGGADFLQEAERVAELLNKSVQVSIGLAASMDIKAADSQSDAVRLALAALAAPLIAEQYRLSGRVPGDNEIKRMIKALEAVLTFSDNFAPAAENTARLEAMSPGSAADETQIAIQYVGALVPVVNAIAAFPFGRQESQLAQDVTARLVKKAAAVRESLSGGGGSEKESKLAELGILKALAVLYVECHREETARLLAMDEQARAASAEKAGGMLPMDSVWSAFDTRAGMVEVIGKNVFPGASVTSKAPPVAASAPIPEVEKPLPPIATESPESGGDDGGAPSNPMAFFKPVKIPPASGDSAKDGEG